MNCKNCKKEIPDGSVFCLYCGKKQIKTPRKTIKRENNSGTVYKRSDLKSRPWAAATPAQKGDDRRYHQQIIGYYETAQKAKDALDEYRRNPTTKLNITVKQLHEEWLPRGYKKISDALKNNYNSCWYKLRTIYDIKFRELRTQQMQDIIDYYDDDHQKEGPGGKLIFDKKTKQPVIDEPLSFSSLSKIKALLTMMYNYALENDIVNKNYAKFIILPEKGESSKERFTEVELKKIENAVDKVPFADCVLMMCYTGYRIGEFLSLDKFSIHYHNKKLILSGGEKTEAGKKRFMPVHSKVQKLFKKWIKKNGDTIICDEKGKPFTIKHFRDYCYYPALEQIGVRKLSPHATRRTFSTRSSAAGMRPEDLIALMGHTDFDVDIDSYINQEVDTLIKAVEKLS